MHLHVVFTFLLSLLSTAVAHDGDPRLLSSGHGETDINNQVDLLYNNHCYWVDDRASNLRHLNKLIFFVDRLPPQHARIPKLPVQVLPTPSRGRSVSDDVRFLVRSLVNSV